MPKLVDLTGETIFRWKVLHQCEPPAGKTGVYWMCECQCDKKTTRPVGACGLNAARRGLVKGSSRSCGCLKVKHGESAYKSRKSTPTYVSWVTARYRCTDKKGHDWQRYGGREPYPVCVCEGFQVFQTFKSVVGERPEDMTLDRINNDGPNSNYSCGQCPQCITNGWTLNCRWATAEQQARNRSNNVVVETQEGDKKLVDLLDQNLPVKEATVRSRLFNGWSADEAVSTPSLAKKGDVYIHNGEELTLTQLAAMYRISRPTLAKRIKNGWPIEDALSVPVDHRRGKRTAS